MIFPNWKVAQNDSANANGFPLCRSFLFVFFNSGQEEEGFARSQDLHGRHGLVVRCCTGEVPEAERGAVAARVFGLLE